MCSIAYILAFLILTFSTNWEIIGFEICLIRSLCLTSYYVLKVAYMFFYWFSDGGYHFYLHHVNWKNEVQIT